MPTLVASITSAVDRAEGLRAQRMETLQLELIRVVRSQASAMVRMAEALEGIRTEIRDGFQELQGKAP